MSTNQALTTLQDCALKSMETVCLHAPELVQQPMARNTAIASVALGFVFWVNPALNMVWVIARISAARIANNTNVVSQSFTG